MVAKQVGNTLINNLINNKIKNDVRNVYTVPLSPAPLPKMNETQQTINNTTTQIFSSFIFLPHNNKIGISHTAIFMAILL
jgi:hypothetical protein